MKSLSPLRRYRLRQVVLIAIAWTIFGVFLETNRKMLMVPIQDESTENQELASQLMALETGHHAYFHVAEL